MDMDYRRLLEHDVYRNSKNIVLCCNQTAFDHSARNYLFDILASEKKLLRILQPEHGLFSAIQDQENIGNEKHMDIPCISMYDKSNGVTGPDFSMLEDADALIIDLQDAGVRYFTYTTHMFNLIEFTAVNLPSLPILVINRENPAGDKIEGIPLPEKYKSFLGYAGMIHRHGMNTRALCEWFRRQHNLDALIYYVDFPSQFNNNQYISPSPNLPVLESLQVYPGQCFWEATTFSEGRGTTRPFTLFGHPDLSQEDATSIAGAFNSRFKDLAYLRFTRFIPVFHKHCHTVCNGWQIHLEQANAYHSIFGALWIMRAVNERWKGTGFWREGRYEFDSDYSAAALLIGDDDLIAFVDGKREEKDILTLLVDCEKKWQDQNRENYVTG